MSDRYLVTGASGCIGAWVVHALLERGDEPVLFDLRDDRKRLRQLLPMGAEPDVRVECGDLGDFDAVAGALERSGANRIVHLAGLQVPFCKADPIAGARVNVLGTVHVFEAALRAGIERVAYASSAAVYGPGKGDVAESDPCVPTTHYGVYKCANEGNARIYFQDSGLTTVGLRPLTVYGVGRDQGLTSDVTKAMKAAVVGRPFTIRFGGSTDLIHARDVAAAFLAAADDAPAGTHVFNLHGESVAIEAAVARIRELTGATGIDCDGAPLPIPPVMVDAAIQDVLPGLPRTSFADGAKETIDAFAQLHAEGRLPVEELDV